MRALYVSEEPTRGNVFIATSILAMHKHQAARVGLEKSEILGPVALYGVATRIDVRGHLNISKR